MRRAHRLVVAIVAVMLLAPASWDLHGASGLSSVAEAKKKKKKKKSKKKGTRKATLSNFKRSVSAYLKFRVKKGGDAGKLLHKYKARWTKMACEKLKGNPTEKCKKWFEEINLPLLIKYRPEVKQILDINRRAVEQLKEIDHEARQAAKRKKERQARKKGATSCQRGEMPVLGADGKLAFCGLVCKLCKGYPDKVTRAEYERHMSGEFARESMKKWQDEQAHSSVACTKERKQLFSKKTFQGLEKEFNKEKFLDCQSYILDQMHNRVRRHVQARLAWGQGDSGSDHAMHALRKKRYKEAIQMVMRQVRAVLDNDLPAAARKAPKDRIAEYKKFLRLVKSFDAQIKGVNIADEKEMAGINKKADTLEKAARVVQKVIIKTAAGAVFVFTGGNEWARCMTEAGLQTAADTAGEAIISEANKVTATGVAISAAKNIAQSCGGKMLKAVKGVAGAALKKVTDVLGKLGAKLKRAIGWLYEKFKSLGSKILNLLKRFRGNGRLLKKVVSFLKKVAGKGKELLGKAIEFVKKHGGKALDKFKEWVSKGAKAVAKGARKVGEVVAKGARKAGEVLVKAGKGAAKVLRKGGELLAKGARKAGEVLVKAGKGAAKVLRKGGELLAKGARKAGRALAKVGRKVAALAKKAFEAIKRLGAKAANVVKALARGFGRAAKAALRALGKAGKKISSWLKRLGRAGRKVLNVLLTKIPIPDAVKKWVLREITRQGVCRAAVPAAFGALINNALSGARSLKRLVVGGLEKLGKAILGKPVSSVVPGALLEALGRVSDRMVEEGAARFREVIRAQCLDIKCPIGTKIGKVMKQAGSCLLDAVKKTLLRAAIEGLKGLLVEAIDAARRGVEPLRRKVQGLISAFGHLYPPIGQLASVATNAAAKGLDLFLRMARPCPEKLGDNLRATVGPAVACVIAAAKAAWRSVKWPSLDGEEGSTEPGSDNADAAEPAAKGGDGWRRIPGRALDIGVGPDGLPWVVGAKRRLHRWSRKRRGWEHFPVGHAFTRVAVGPHGAVWAINTRLRIFKLEGNKWRKMPGNAYDVAISSDGSVWIAGRSGSVFRWDVPRKRWVALGKAIGFKRVAAGASGTWAITKQHRIMQLQGPSWKLMPGAALDIAVGAGGDLWVVGVSKTAHRWNQSKARWISSGGRGLANIAAAPDGGAWATAGNTAIYRRPR